MFQRISFIDILFLITFVFLLALKPVSLITFYLLSIYGVYSMLHEKTNPFQNKPLRAFAWTSVLFFGIFALSVVLSSSPYCHKEHLGRLIPFLVAPFVLTAIRKTNISFHHFLLAIAGGVVTAVSIAGAELLLLDSHRASGMYNPNTFSDILAVMGILLLAGTLKYQNKYRLIFWMLSLLAFVGIIIAGSRGAMLTFISANFILAVVVFLFDKENRRFIAQSVIAVTILFTFVIFANSTIEQRFAHIDTEIAQWQQKQNKTSSVIDRIEMYRSGLIAFSKRPIWGYGYHAAAQEAAKVCLIPAAKKRINRYWHLHNEYISALVNAGIFGWLALMMLFLVPLYFFGNAYKSNHNKDIAISGFAIILTYMISGITHGEFGYGYETLFFIMSIGFLLHLLSKETNVGE